ncbi:unnamed protein product, partial [marine sediment metagenome]
NAIEKEQRELGSKLGDLRRKLSGADEETRNELDRSSSRKGESVMAGLTSFAADVLPSPKQ